MTEQSLLLIKPDAVKKNHVGHIITIMEQRGFTLKNIKVLQFDRKRAAEFYMMHAGKDFYERLLDFMCSGTTVALLLERIDAVAKLRKLVGDADPNKRAPDTIRAMFADGVTENAVHASDSTLSAKREIALIFKGAH
ncbi:MAG TPA: nucleoside-diphosphate kinase [Candidatus Cloacimonadota bacterium]|nr:nucleoside-diphosphate kinase [Candidatus Cloacimonadota bacterium]